MRKYFAPNRKGFIYRGILSIIVGGVLAFVPGLTMKTVVTIVGIMILINGLISLISSFRKNSGISGFGIAQGILNLAIGLVFLLSPDSVVNFFIVIIGVIFLIIGLLQFVGAISAISKRGFLWILFLSSLIMIAGGLFMLTNPFKSAETILAVLGVILILYGLSELFTSWKLSKTPDTYDGKIVQDVAFEELDSSK